MTSTPVRTRMAPSPTGEMHIGTLRTGLYAYAMAKQSGGQFIMRIEDTDQKRLVPGSGERLLQTFKDFGLNYDEGPDVGGDYGPYVQTQRLNIYQKYIKELLDKGHAYYCFCSHERLEEVRQIQKASGKIPRYDRHCLSLSSEEISQKLHDNIPYVVRMKLPDNEDIVFDDLIRGRIKFNTSDLDDQVLIKSDGIPTYHFAVVVDDHLMNITHVVRAEEWISSTPKHILLYQFFNWKAPIFAHLTVLLDPSHPGKMSKRFGSVFAHQFLAEGYLPEALLNFLMLLGWNPGTNQEFFSLDEFVNAFSINHLHKKAAIFDKKKLDYFNGLYIREKISDSRYLELFRKFLPQASDAQVKDLAPILRSRLVKFGDLPESLAFLFSDIKYDKELLLKKGTDPKIASDMLRQTKELFNDFSDLQNRITKLIQDNQWNVGEYFMVLRVAICGVAFTPPIVECLPSLGKESAQRKLDIALSLLK